MMLSGTKIRRILIHEPKTKYLKDLAYEGSPSALKMSEVLWRNVLSDSEKFLRLPLGKSALRSEDGGDMTDTGQKGARQSLSIYKKLLNL